MTKQPKKKQLLFFFFPILIGSFFQQLYNTVDTIIVGQACGTNALAAVGSTGNLTNLVVNFYVGLSTGASVVIAQYYGAHNKDKIHQAVHTSYKDWHHLKYHEEHLLHLNIDKKRINQKASW